MIASFALIVSIKHPAVFCTLAIAIGVYLVFRGLSFPAQKRRQKAPACKIATVLPGLVEVNGFASGPSTISAPVTGQACYLYRSTAWQQRKAPGHEWEKIAEETLHLPFFLEDSTGQLLIEPLGAELDLQSEFHKEYDPAAFREPNNVPPAVSVFLAHHGVVTPARRIRIEECCIRSESAVFIAGTVTENPGVEVRAIAHQTLPRTDAREVIRLSVGTEPLTMDAMTQQSKIAAALVKAGIRNPNAWAAAGLDYPATSRESDTETKLSEPDAQSHRAPSLVLMKGPEDAPFLISWRSQRELGRAYLWQTAVMVAGGSVLTLAGVCALLMQLL